MSALEILSCGPATSIQDLGRPGHARIGLPPAGVMDRRALLAANALVGNAPGEAAIELAFLGLAARALDHPLLVAVTGARTSVSVDGESRSMHESFFLQPGATLRIGAVEDGVFATLAISGGFAISPVMGSRSLDLRAGVGGWQGRALCAGDVLTLRAAATAEARAGLRCDPVPLDRAAPVRIVLGPQQDAFTERGLQTLIGRPFTVSSQMSRMAYRLDGPPIERRAGIEMISDGTLPGSIQVPPDGRPLVLMADRQTVGGYPKIATVISADLPRLAQRRPGEQVELQPVSATEAREIARQYLLSTPAVHRAGAFGALAHDHAVALERLMGTADAVVDAADADMATWEHGVGSDRRRA